MVFVNTPISLKEQEPKAHLMSRAGVRLVAPGYLQARHSVYVAEREYSTRFITGIQNRYWNMLYCCMRM
jgi:hypothetical protein